MLASQAIANLEEFGTVRPPTLSGRARMKWFDRRAELMLAAHLAFAELTETQDELAGVIDDLRTDAGWLQDEQGAWHEPGTEAHDIAQREQLAADYGDMRAKGG